ncbi:MAG: hypothetical protein JWO84_291 [Parcubacteria group bacterium]|nr:hypothetical protein [Parcubacteria group bacterium]
MLFSKSEDLEDLLVRLVLKERHSIKSLHIRAQEGTTVSERAVYKSVDKLIKAGVLLKAGKRLLVDEEWAQKASTGLRPLAFAIPSPGERMTYTFTSISRLDAFWKTIMLPMELSLSGQEIFFYNPHDFWAYVTERKESEDRYYHHFSETKQHAFFTVGGETEADRQFKREYQNEYLQIDTRGILALSRTDHVTIIGSIIITVRVNKKVAAQIDQLYESGGSVEAILPGIEAILRKPGTIRLIIEDRAPKATQLRKVLAKNFYFKRGD